MYSCNSCMLCVVIEWNGLWNVESTAWTYMPRWTYRICIFRGHHQVSPHIRIVRADSHKSHSIAGLRKYRFIQPSEYRFYLKRHLEADIRLFQVCIGRNIGFSTSGLWRAVLLLFPMWWSRECDFSRWNFVSILSGSWECLEIQVFPVWRLHIGFSNFAVCSNRSLNPHGNAQPRKSDYT